MFVGHLAVALGARRLEPRVSLGAGVAAAFGLDLIWPIFLLLGLETVEVRAGDTAFTNLTFVSYPWSHSLLTALGWSALVLLIARRVYQSWRAGGVLAALVLSHWVLDFVTHRPDLPLWPGGPLAGLGLWQSIVATLLLEGTLFLVCIAIYVTSTRAIDGTGRWALAGLLLLTSVIWATQPYSPPPPSASAVAWGGLILWLLPPWARWIDNHRLMAQVMTRRSTS